MNPSLKTTKTKNKSDTNGLSRLFVIIEMTPNFSLCEPTLEQDWQSYFELRWRLLRSPWQQPPGSEKDTFDLIADSELVKHIMARLSDGQIIGVGRIHRLDSYDAQIRYMAVEKTFRRQGVAGEILLCLEKFARQWQCVRIVVNARENIKAFYSAYDYKVAGAGEILFNKIPHVLMHKQLKGC